MLEVFARIILRAKLRCCLVPILSRDAPKRVNKQIAEAVRLLSAHDTALALPARKATADAASLRSGLARGKRRAVMPLCGSPTIGSAGGKS